MEAGGKGRPWRRGTASGSRSGGGERRVLLWLVCVCVWESGAETLRYSVWEEMARDSSVGNVARDLGLSPSQLAARKARVVSEGSEQHFRLDPHSGVLTVTETLDRERICPHSESCALFFKLSFENPVQLIRGEVEVRDVNDNSPVFPQKEVVLEIPEMASTGSRFPLEEARDKDLGINGLQNYSLSPNSHFSLALETGKGGAEFVKLVLERPLDREEHRELHLVLTATDGGSPPRSGTVEVRVVVLDANDNMPVFSREVYEVRVAENSPPGQLVVRVSAADPDEGSNGKVEYEFTSEESGNLFYLNAATGEIRVLGNLDFEETEYHDIEVKATDGGGLSAHCKVHVEVLDVNDNAPEIELSSVSASVPEDAPPGTVVALLSVRDRDSGDNGRPECAIEGDVPFRLTAAFADHYELRTSAALDRETTAEYNAAYSMWVSENEAGAVRLGSVKATDADAGANGRVRYALVREEGEERPAVSVDAESGDVSVVRPLDYEEVRAVEVTVRAADGGSPPRSATALLRVLVRDENDNAPVVLHPPADGGAALGELVPRRARAGYLVAKVVAVDADAGQNAWLCYELAKATEPGLFRVGLHSGEVRTARAVGERDAARHRLVVLVRDRGRPPRSASATLAVALADGFSEGRLRASEEAPAAEPDGRLTLYLSVCLACVSALFVAGAAAAVAAKVRRARRGEPGTLPTFPRSAADSGAGSLPRSYVYDVRLAAGTVDSEFRFLGPLFPCFPAGLPQGAAEQRSSLCSAGLGQEEGDWAVQGRSPFPEDTAPRPAEENTSLGQCPWLTHL
uniref:Cadherin domain-containing protein n=1 Tax=Meleagris gallopavo TaxID=9103 RepID=A0A803XMI6_MELGA